MRKVKVILSIILCHIFLSISASMVSASEDSGYLTEDMLREDSWMSFYAFAHATVNEPICMGGESYPHGVSRYNTLGNSWAGVYNIPPWGVPGFGDEWNDIEFTEFTGIFGPVDGTRNGKGVLTIRGTGYAGATRDAQNGDILAVLYSSAGEEAEHFSVDITGYGRLYISIEMEGVGSSLSVSGTRPNMEGFALVAPTFTYNNSSIKPLTNRGYPYLRVFEIDDISYESTITMIQTASELAAIGGSQSEGKYFSLENDIQLTGTWTPIEDFRGILDGAGHIITGMNASTSINGQASGLFGTINTGNVAIRNLGVEGRVFAGISTADDINTLNPRQTVSVSAGGLIGHVEGGSVVIENCYFSGNINVSSRIFNITSVLWALLLQPLNIADKITGNIVGNMVFDENSYAFAGGLVGRVDGKASVEVENSYTRGNVVAVAETTPATSIQQSTSCHSHAGGLVGSKAEGTLTVGNSYSISGVVADSLTFNILNDLLPPPNRYAGALFAYGNPDSTTGNIYRPSVSRVFGNRDKINNTGTPLSHKAMQEASSYVGWDFNNVWIIDSSELFEPSSTYVTSLSIVRESETELTLEIDRDFSLFDSVSVNDILLTQGIHYEAISGSTKVTLMPSYLDSLNDGFHSLVIAFTDGVYVEEQFFIIPPTKNEIPPVNRIYINSTLVFQNGDVLVDENFFESLNDNIKFRVEFADGNVVDESILIDDRAIHEKLITSFKNTISGFTMISVAISIILVILCIFGVGVLAKKCRCKSKRIRSRETTEKLERTLGGKYCSLCGVESRERSKFCYRCGGAVARDKPNTKKEEDRHEYLSQLRKSVKERCKILY